MILHCADGANPRFQQRPDNQENLSSVPANLKAALDYLGHRFAVVPQLPGMKHPCIKWKRYQERLPTQEELCHWFQQWPDAGMAVILGPISGLFAVDVDGPEAHQALLAKLGDEPVAPKVLSGSGRPFRYHLFFRHPDIPTKAKATPWHEQLEFRGNRGIIILPPSLHKSGNCYRFADGRSFDDIELPALPRLILEELLAGNRRKAAGPFQTPTNPTSCGRIHGPDLDLAQQLARAYVAEMPPAIEGQGGDLQTFTVACRLVVGFGLTPEQALPLLQEYNQRCVPPWPEEMLASKLQKAVEKAEEKPEEVGRLLTAGLQGSGRPGPAPVPPTRKDVVPAVTPYLGTLPDFILADRHKVRPRPRRRDEQGRLRRGRPWLCPGLAWLLRAEVIRQKRAAVHLPDVLVAQTVWGRRGAWPANWRQRVRGWLLGLVRSVWRDQTIEDNPDLVRACPAHCPLHDGDVPHRHFVVTVPRLYKAADDGSGYGSDFDASFLGVLELFRLQDEDEEGFDFARARGDNDDIVKQRQEQIDAYKKRGRLRAVYLPALLFGTSRRSGLTHEGRNLLTALTGETTRSRQSGRADKAAVVVGGKPESNGQSRIAACPFLQPGVRYVGFNGNGGYKRARLRGRGYHLIGRTGGGWLARAGFRVPDDKEGQWQSVRDFLRELQKLAESFGLVAAGWHMKKRRWYDLDDMIGMTKTPASRSWLNGCKLRVYGPADYLIRWRRYFADRLGFSVIPGGGDEGEPVPAADDAGGTKIESATDLDCWMRRAGMTDQQLADRMGRSRSLVSAYRFERRRWSKTFQDQVAAVLAAKDSDGREEGLGFPNSR
jgi:hypothetical protein